MKKKIPNEISQKLHGIQPGTRLEVRYYPNGEKAEQAVPFHKDTVARCDTYQLGHGLEVMFDYYLSDEFEHHHQSLDKSISVNYCRQGRIVWNMMENMCLYLGEGDMSVHMKSYCSSSTLTFPTGYYEGTSISIDIDVLKKDMPPFLLEAGIDADILCQKVSQSGPVISFKHNCMADVVFSHLHSVPDEIKFPYFTLKCEELLLLLYNADMKRTDQPDKFYYEQVELIKEIHAFLTRQPQKRYTVEELSKKYMINSSALKEIFKAVYGMPVATYMKKFRINTAATMLAESDENISVIAGAVGYESQSKFATAFKEQMGILPTEYRKNIKNGM